MLYFRKFLLVSVGFTLIFGFCSVIRHSQLTNAQVKPLTYPEIITALNTKLPNSVFKNKTQLINFLITDVKKRKVDKPLTRDREDDLRQAGATNQLIEAIRANSPSVQITPTPTVTPATPTPTPTPPKTNPKQIRNSTGMEFVLIPRGSFLMGSPEAEKDRSNNESPQHRVTIDYEFYLGKFEVTQAQWKALMGELPEGMQTRLDADFKENPNQPVVRISWNDAKDFIARLNSRNDGFLYRLPSEAEWEYAARAGTQTRFYWGDDFSFTSLCKYANVKDYSDCRDNYYRTAPVGTYSPNNFGLYDMTGNVWEWCEDIWQDNYENLPADGLANISSGDDSKRVQRGGSWADNPKQVRTAVRGYDVTTDRNDEDGFRVVARPR